MNVSANAAYQNATKPLAATSPAVYSKLNNLETNTSAALISLSATKSAALIREMEAEEDSLLAGYRVKILDGNALGSREHRLTESNPWIDRRAFAG